MSNWISERVNRLEKAHRLLRKTVDHDINVANQLDSAMRHNRVLTIVEWDKAIYPDFVGFHVTGDPRDQNLYVTFAIHMVELTLTVSGQRIPDSGNFLSLSIGEDDEGDIFFYNFDQNKTFRPQQLSEYALAPLIFQQ